MYTSPEPRSGCAITKIVGTSAAINTRTVVSRRSQLPCALDDERGQRHDQQHLPELGGLKGEQREVDRANRAVGRVPESEHREDAHDQGRVDHVFVAAQMPVVQPRQAQHRRESDRQIDRLANDVVVGAAGKLARGRGERDDRADAQSDHRQRQQRVQRQAQRARRRRRSIVGNGDRAEWAQNVFDVPATNFFGFPYHCEAIRRAMGAAVSAPKPPSSTVTAITIGRCALPR